MGVGFVVGSRVGMEGRWRGGHAQEGLVRPHTGENAHDPGLGQDVRPIQSLMKGEKDFLTGQHVWEDQWGGCLKRHLKTIMQLASSMLSLSLPFSVPLSLSLSIYIYIYIYASLSLSLSPRTLRKA